MASNTVRDGAFIRRLNKATLRRGLAQYFLEDESHPPLDPVAREGLLKKLAVYKSARLPDCFLSIREAADFAGCGPPAVCNWLKAGKLTAHTHASPVYPKGKASKAFQLTIPTLDRVKPFGVAIDHKGNAWVAGTLNSSLTVYDPRGELIDYIESPAGQELSRPAGVASDSQGNMWVANSDVNDQPCPPGGLLDGGPGTDPSIALFHRHPNREPHVGSPFTGGGLTWPWGIAVDGNDTVWVANFGFPFDLNDQENAPSWEEPNRVSHFCGVDTLRCPLTKQGVGMPISPDGTGYTSMSLIRNTGIAIDPSGNVWLANNWKEIPPLRNPGGNSVAVMVGAAAPLKTPLIGAPRSFNQP